MTKHSPGRLALSALIAAFTVAVGLTSPAFAGTRSAANGSVASKKKLFAIGDATVWVNNWGTQSHLKPETPAPQQITDPAAAALRPYQDLIKAGFRGVAIQFFTLTQPDPTQPSLLVGNYIVRAFVFASTGDARKFRDADAKGVTDKRTLVRVGTYQNGILLADTQGHVNDMFAIANVVVDLRIGVTENTKLAGVNTVKTLQDVFSSVANAKPSK
jgi:hypothetical protein